MELLLSHPAMAKFRHGSAGVGGYVDICVRSGQGVNSYISVSMSNFAFTVNHPAPQPSWGYGVARWDIRKRQTLRDVVHQLQQAGLTGADLCHPSHSTPLAVRGDNVNVSRTYLP
jgi:hypothetical protein